MARGRPYDLAVTAALIIAKQHLKGAITVPGNTVDYWLWEARVSDSMLVM